MLFASDVDAGATVCVSGAFAGSALWACALLGRSTLRTIIKSDNRVWIFFTAANADISRSIFGMDVLPSVDAIF
jgi:hypothetical protein